MRNCNHNTLTKTRLSYYQLGVPMNTNNKIILATGLSFSILTLQATEPICTNDTSNVSHQFYDALVQTPAEALTHVGHATKDVASAIANSDAGQELKTAGKQLAVEAPLKAGYAIKNGVIKAAQATAHTAQVAYEVAVRKPAHAVKDAAIRVAHSDVVQGTKETALELGEQFKDAGVQIKDATVYGARKVYRVLVQKPVGAVKAAAHYLAHSEDEMHPAAVCQHPDQCSQSNDQIYVAIVPKATDPIDEIGRLETIHVNNGKPYSQVEMAPNPVNHSHDVILQFEVETPHSIDLSNEPLSHHTMHKVADAFNAIKHDLCSR